MSTDPTSQRMLTPPQIARRLGVSADKVSGWIKRGELRGYNLGASPGGRPRYHVDPADLQAFLSARAAAAPGHARRLGLRVECPLGAPMLGAIRHDEHEA